MAEQRVSIVFEGSGDLLPFLQETREQVNGLRVVHSQANAGIQADLKKTAEEVAKTGQTYNAASKLVVALAQSAQQGVPQLIRNLSTVADLSETIGASLSEADKANFSAVNAGLREVAKNEKIIVEDIEEAKAARIDALVAAKKLTAEEASLLKQVQAVVDTFKKLDKVSLPAVSLPSASGEPSATAPPDALLSNAQLLREAYAAAAEEAGKIGEQFGKDSAAYVLAAQNAEKLKKELAASAAAGAPLAQRLKAAQVEAEKIAKTSGINTKEFKAAAAAAAAIKVEIDKTNAALGVQVGELEGVRQQYRAALVAAQNLSETPGPEYDAALEEVARLKKLLDDTASSVRNLNPGDKVRAFSQLGNAIAGGAQAISGIAIAFGGNNQALQETLFKFQSVLFAVQGAQTFLKDFGDSLKDVRRVLGLTTVETVKSTVASEVDAVAKGEQAVATTAVGTASAGSVTPVKALASAMLSLPVLAIAAGLALVVGALYALSQGSEEAKKSYADLKEEIEKSSQLKSFDAELRNAKRLKEIEDERLQSLIQVKLGKITQAEADKADIEARRKAEKVFQDETIQGIRARQKAEEDAATAIQNAYDKVKPGADSSPKQQEDALKFLGLTAEATADEISKAYDEMYFERIQSAEQAVTEINRIEGEQLSGSSARTQEAIDKQRELANATRDIREQLAEQIEAIEKQLADKIRELEVGGADPRAQLELQKQAADEELALLERNLRREIALQELRVKIGTAAFQELSEAQKEARADAIIEDGGGELSTKQEEAFSAARLLIWQDYFRKVAELQAEFDLTIAQASGDSQVIQLAELDALLAERAAKLKAAGATEAEIEADAGRQTGVVQKKIATDRLALEEQTQVDLLEAKLAAAKGDEAQEVAIQEQILKVKIDYAKKALALIEDNGEAENDAAIAAAKKTIAELESGLGDLKGEIKPFRLSDLFDLDPKYADQFDAAAAQLGQAVLDIASQNIAAEQAQLDAQIENTDALIEDYRRRGDELQAQLEKDEELNRQGLANNLNATLAAIEENKKAEAAALAEKKRIQAEKQKLARQQVIIDSISQASSLAVSAANTIQSLSSLPLGLGILTAFALVAQMYSFFAGFKAKLAAASQPQQFREGTKSVQLNGSPDGVDTVPAMLTRDEAVVPVEQNRKHRGLVGAIIDDDFSKLTPKQLEPILARIDLTPLLAEHGITVNAEEVGKVVTMNNTYRERVEKAGEVDMRGMEQRLDLLTAEVKSFRRQEGDKPETATLPDGTVRVKRPGRTEYIRP